MITACTYVRPDIRYLCHSGDRVSWFFTPRSFYFILFTSHYYLSSYFDVPWKFRATFCNLTYTSFSGVKFLVSIFHSMFGSCQYYFAMPCRHFRPPLIAFKFASSAHRWVQLFRLSMTSYTYIWNIIVTKTDSYGTNLVTSLQLEWVFLFTVLITLSCK